MGLFLFLVPVLIPVLLYHDNWLFRRIKFVQFGLERLAQLIGEDEIGLLRIRHYAHQLLIGEVVGEILIKRIPHPQDVYGLRFLAESGSGGEQRER